jgi:GNAT superfamily N-acetyltransferase
LVKVRDRKGIWPFFESWEETMIWSCLQGIMGELYTDDPEKPTAAVARLGDFAFFSGEPNLELISCVPEKCGKQFMIFVPQNTVWRTMIEGHYGEQAKTILRFATKKERDMFDREQLNSLATRLPAGYEMCLIDEEIYDRCSSEEWSRDLVSNFQNYEEYHRLGLGVAVCRDGRVVSGASSYSRYQEGIEIEIDTKEEYRRRGLASACGAGLILECLKRGLYPSWDAHSRQSLSLAEKLGYQYSHEYSAIEIWKADR